MPTAYDEKLQERLIDGSLPICHASLVRVHRILPVSIKWPMSENISLNAPENESSYFAGFPRAELDVVAAAFLVSHSLFHHVVMTCDLAGSEQTQRIRRLPDSVWYISI